MILSLNLTISKNSSLFISRSTLTLKCQVTVRSLYKKVNLVQIYVITSVTPGVKIIIKEKIAVLLFQHSYFMNSVGEDSKFV
jgi:hypothetical protein